MKKNSIAWLITKPPMSYCCEWKFFSLYHDCEMIAARLGVTSRAVRYHKLAYENYEIECEGCENCMKTRRPK